MHIHDKSYTTQHSIYPSLQNQHIYTSTYQYITDIRYLLDDFNTREIQDATFSWIGPPRKRTGFFAERKQPASLIFDANHAARRLYSCLTTSATDSEWFSRYHIVTHHGHGFLFFFSPFFGRTSSKRYGLKVRKSLALLYFCIFSVLKPDWQLLEGIKLGSCFSFLLSEQDPSTQRQMELPFRPKSFSCLMP